jgi:hypothetical protein
MGRTAHIRIFGVSEIPANDRRPVELIESVASCTVGTAICRVSIEEWVRSVSQGVR